MKPLDQEIREQFNVLREDQDIPDEVRNKLIRNASKSGLRNLRKTGSRPPQIRCGLLRKQPDNRRSRPHHY